MLAFVCNILLIFLSYFKNNLSDAPTRSFKNMKSSNPSSRNRVDVQKIYII